MNSRIWIIVAWLLCSAIGCQGSDGGQNVVFDHRHETLDSLLARHVSNGLVDYEGLLGERSDLAQYLGQVAAVEPETYDRFTMDERLAFLINVYNAYTIELILDHYPVSSIQEIPKAWDAFQWPLLSGSFSLNQIEHELIRREFNEPRIHLALVCAAKGCPPLIPNAYRHDLLEQQLASASRAYLSDRRRNRLDQNKATLYISKVFEWYAEDFVPLWGKSPVPEGAVDTPTHRALIGFFIEYMPEADADYLESNPVRVETLDYDWTLNDAE